MDRVHTLYSTWRTKSSARIKDQIKQLQLIKLPVKGRSLMFLDRLRIPNGSNNPNIARDRHMFGSGREYLDLWWSTTD